MLGMKKSHLWCLPGVNIQESCKRDITRIAMYIDFVTQLLMEQFEVTKRCKLMQCLTKIWCLHMRRVFFLRMSSFMEMPKKQTYSTYDMSLLPDTSVLVEVNTLRRTKKTYIITCTVASPVHQPKHSSKQRPLRLKRCFLMFSAPKPLKQQFFCNKSFRQHCKGNVFFSRSEKSRCWKNKRSKFCHLQKAGVSKENLNKLEKQIQASKYFSGGRFWLLWLGKIHPPMEETDGLPRCEMRVMQMAGLKSDIWIYLYNYMYITVFYRYTYIQ